MTVRWTVRAANDRSRDRAARVDSRHLHQNKVGGDLTLSKIENIFVYY